MKKTDKKTDIEKPYRISINLTNDEEKLLKIAAVSEGLSVGALLKKVGLLYISGVKK